MDSVLWFKKDLRIHDHQALTEALRQSRVMCIYIMDPAQWQQLDQSAQHYAFTLACLRDLYRQLREVGALLHILSGSTVEVLARIQRIHPFAQLYSHEETGNFWSYQRDKQVAKWCREQGVQWFQYPQFGVKRRLDSRDHWQRLWQQHMSQPVYKLPAIGQRLWWSESVLQKFVIPEMDELGLKPMSMDKRPQGGRQAALLVWQRFMDSGVNRYRGGISSPLSAPTACSRMSVYLTYGCVSMRELVQWTHGELDQLMSTNRDPKRLGLQAFLSRLYWHCHFIQKLESEPEIEWRNMHRGYDGLRENEFNQHFFELWQSGQTGWPLVDASMAMLKHEGWLNFRMRALLVSVASYPLWLHWRQTGLYLAGQFLDYEPGIHWSQMQMQSGTTGINIPRVYNPIKQAKDHDPKGVFVRRWCPYLKRVPDSFIFEPYLMPRSMQDKIGVWVGRDIPTPLVNYETSVRLAKDKLFARRNTDTAVSQAREVLERHGSRSRSNQRKRGSSAAQANASSQLGFEFDEGR
ncbi:MAG: deoxyribodipyrimidine photolyase [Ferrovum sp. 37-45-19]|nr:MAG: deoxyribodipyrimidine photolyase [Ferrovum sp. 21-44-67]OYV94052.1 MAG: deoxyribodipyrimidine photolyase [Ferrovum sp. 37-45-19]HQT82325.1 FAD-binding domain-containing protein [Ferrovaceae bacterium]HQU07342.1 FAD-binding domain-containing protein [Ferrovaceae bacterium]